MRRDAALGVVALMFLAPISPAAAQNAKLLGGWTQIDSNAGQCSSCGIRVSRSGRSLIVEANNGWSAAARGFFKGGAVADGRGAWKKSVAGPYSGKPFTVRLRLVGPQLHMSMIVTPAGGQRSVVRAVYERAEWPGV